MSRAGALARALGEGLETAEEILVTSRAGTREVTVRMTLALSPSGGLHLMTSAFSRKAQRWERDPWVRLRLPGGEVAVEGIVRRVGAADLHGAAQAAILSRFGISGAATPEGLRELLASGTHLLFRVEPGAV